MSESNFVCLDVAEVVAETALAVLFKFPDGKNAWVPFSVISDLDVDNFKKGDKHLSVSVQEWFAKKENLTPRAP